MKELEIFLKAFEKRTPKQKQEYIFKLTKENNQLRNELNELKTIVEDMQYDIELINNKV